MLYSDKWIKQGYTSGERISIGNGQPIDYRIWYDGSSEIGVTIDFEYAEDAHYEFLWEEFGKLMSIWGGEENFLTNMQKFFSNKQPYFMFSNFLDENEIEYKMIVFY